ncbi:MAG: hypothetical protein QOG35_1623 [Solirubrobacteraceae bacterium]|nr:hypothetical protein [Solirubrobacteraceae bacterium]
MAALGHPIDHLSDEDIVAGVLVLGRAANAASMTAAEVEAGLRDALSAWGRGSVTVGGRNPS